MKTDFHTLQVLRRGVGIGLVVLVIGQALPVAAQDRSERLRRFEADRQACLSGKSSQVLDSCTKEAKAALAERPDSTATVSPEQLKRNSMTRCEALTGEERTACVARMRGEGTISGSMPGGGVLRELVTPEWVASPPLNPASAAVRQ